MKELTTLQAQIDDLKAKIEQNSITPVYLGSILAEIKDVIESMGIESIESDASSAVTKATTAINRAELALERTIDIETISAKAAGNAAQALSTANAASKDASSALIDAAKAVSDAAEALSAASNAQSIAGALAPRVDALEAATVGMEVAAVAGWIDDGGAECESDGASDGSVQVAVSYRRTGFIRLCDGSFTFTSPGGTQLVVVKYNGNTLAERIVCEGNSWAVRYSEGMLEIGEVVFNQVRLCYKRGAVAGVADNITVSAKASAIATLTERNKAGVAEVEELRAYAEGNHGDIATLTERLRDAESHIRLHCEQIAAMRPVQITEEELETLTAEEGRLYFIPEEE